MDTIETINQRRSVKHYDANHQMTDQEIQELLSSAILSPTSFNMQNWRFVAVTDPELRKEIRAASWDQAQVTDASVLFILAADLKAWGKEPTRYWKDADPKLGEMMSGMMAQFYEGQDQLQRDEAMRSIGIAAQTIMLAAKSMGYDSCPMIGFDPVKTAELINLPEDHVLGMFITIGKAAKPANPRGGQLPLEEVVIRDRF